MPVETAPVTAAQYAAIFERERKVSYPKVEQFEARLGYAVNLYQLEEAARVLACPLKANPPNWQHGRILYAVARQRLAKGDEPFLFLDIGTAKGFSALCLQWALDDNLHFGRVVSLDVISPTDRVYRNTVAEVDGHLTLAEILAPWPEARRIEFLASTGRHWLTGHPLRVHLAFVDGKHTYDAVSWDAALIAQRQESGDVIVFDDLQIPGVNQAVAELKGYDVERLFVLSHRGYAIARKR